MPLTISIEGDISKSLAGINKKVHGIIDNELNSFGLDTVAMAKSLCPVDEGFLRNSITFDKFPLAVEIIVAADYAAFVEFGTRRFAAAYVASLPATWQQYAASFKGRGGGDFKDFLLRITEWVHRKGLGSGFVGKIGLAGSYSTKTRKRIGGKSAQANEDRQVAYIIALSILRNGIRPHPFLYPSITANTIKLQANLKRALT